MFEDLAKLSLHALGRQARGFFQQLFEGHALEGCNPEFSKQLLLADPPPEVRRQSR
jgi:hypothetical protein